MPGADRRPGDGIRRWDILYGLIADVTGRHVIRGQRAFNDDEPALVGVRLANDLRSRGGTEVLGMLRGMERVPSPQPE